MAIAAAAPAAIPVRSPRRERSVSCVSGSFSFFRSFVSQRSTNLMACTGQPPPQVWHSVQSAVRVVKSGLIASKGQISTHLLHLMQLDSTLRSPTRQKLKTENTAPDGHT